jgi:hypothetical protein
MLKTAGGQAFRAPEAADGAWEAATSTIRRATRSSEPTNRTTKFRSASRRRTTACSPIAGGPADPAYIRSKEISSTDPNAVKVLGKGGELYKLDKDGNPVVVT